MVGPGAPAAKERETLVVVDSEMVSTAAAEEMAASGCSSRRCTRGSPSSHCKSGCMIRRMLRNRKTQYPDRKDL